MARKMAREGRTMEREERNGDRDGSAQLRLHVDARAARSFVVVMLMD